MTMNSDLSFGFDPEVDKYLAQVWVDLAAKSLIWHVPWIPHLRVLVAIILFNPLKTTGFGTDDKVWSENSNNFLDQTYLLF